MSTLEIFQKVSRNFSKSCSKNDQKLLFVTKVAQKLLEKNKNFFCSDVSACKLYNKSKISKHLLAIWGRITSVAKQLCPQLKPKNVMSQ